MNYLARCKLFPAIGSIIIIMCSIGCKQSKYSYTGDGNYESIDTRTGLVAVKGFKIELPAFPLDKDGDFSFTLGELPPVNTELQVLLVVEKKLSHFQKPPSPHVSVTVLDTTNNVELMWERDFHKLRWGWPVYGQSAYGLYEENSLGFTSKAGRGYQLKVSYTSVSNDLALHGENAKFVILGITGGK